MNIGIFTATYLPSVNGISLTLSNTISMLEKRGHRVFIATPNHAAKSTQKENFLYYSSAPIPEYLRKKLIDDEHLPWWHESEVLDFFKKNSVDLIHVHDSFLLSYSAVKIAQILHVPLVHTYHTQLESYLQSLQILGYGHLLRLGIRHVCQHASCTIVPSEKSEKYLRSIGVTKPIQVLINPPHNRYFDQPVSAREKDALKKRLNLSENDFVVVTFSRIVKEKNIQQLIRALTFIKEHAHIRLLIAGSGKYLPQLKNLSRTLGVSDQIIFYGAYHPKELPGICSISDIFATASLSETQGIMVHEAMMGGLPIIAANDSAYASFVKQSENGFYCEEDPAEYANKIIQLYNDHALRIECSKKSLTLSRNFHSQQTTDQLIALYKKIILAA